MAEDKKKDDIVKVPQSLLTQMQEQMAEMERKIEEEAGKRAGLEEIISNSNEINAVGQPKIREKKNFEPKFRSVRIRKYPIAGDVTNMGYVIGWTNRGAYQEVDRTGVSPQTVDMIDIIFLGQEKTKDGKIKAEKIRLLDLLNKGIQVHCKILEAKKQPRIVPTNEEIDVISFDPQHGPITTGDKIDGYVTYSDIKYIIKIPDVDKPVEIDAEFVN